MENNTTETQAPETTTSASDTEITMSTETTTSDTPVASPAAAPSVKPVPPPVRVTRRVYGAHKVYNTCITVGAFVYLAPLSIADKFDKKSSARLDFIVDGVGADATVLDMDGNVWLCAGENGGCGPRLSALPLTSRDEYKKIWHSLSFSDRITIIRQLVPAKK